MYLTMAAKDRPPIGNFAIRCLWIGFPVFLLGYALPKPFGIVIGMIGALFVGLGLIVAFVWFLGS